MAPGARLQALAAALIKCCDYAVTHPPCCPLTLLLPGSHKKDSPLPRPAQPGPFLHPLLPMSVLVQWVSDSKGYAATLLLLQGRKEHAAASGLRRAR